MAVKFGWFDIPIGGDPLKYKYSGNQMRDIWKSLLTNGIVPEIRQSTTGVIVPTTQLGTALSANVAQGLNVTINNGLAFIDGAYFFVYTPEEIPLQAGWVNDIVLRLDVTGNEIVYGIFNKQRSAGTIEAGLTRQGGVYELGLHSVNIPSGTTQVTASMITDYRLNMSKGVDGLPCCGIVGSLLMPNIDAWYKSATAEQKAWLDKSQADFNSWSAEQKADFTAWFNTLKEVLDLNTATHLYDLITTHTTDKTVHVTTLTHTKVGTVHDLTGAIPTTGIITANFKPSASYADGDNLSINGVTYTLSRQGSFELGIPVQILIDVDAKQVTIGGGEGMGKRSDRYTIPRSNLFSNVNLAQWTYTTIPASSINTSSGVIDGNILYNMSSNRLVKRNLDTYEIISDVAYPSISNVSLDSLFLQDNELYVTGCTDKAPISIVLYKVNEATATRTLVASCPVTRNPHVSGTNLYTPAKVIRLSATKVMFYACAYDGHNTAYSSAVYVYDFYAKLFTDVALSANIKLPQAIYGGYYQFDTSGNVYISAQEAPDKLRVLKINIASLSLTTHGYIAVTPGAVVPYPNSVSIGDKLMFINNVAMAGKTIGEIDLINTTIDATKYNEPATNNISRDNVYVYKDSALIVGVDSVNSLPLSQSPPQNNAKLLALFKGQEVNLCSDEVIKIVALSNGQPEIVLTKTPLKLLSDIDIYQGGYQANYEKSLLVVTK